jgi:hypothetical protein
LWKVFFSFSFFLFFFFVFLFKSLAFLVAYFFA